MEIITGRTGQPHVYAADDAEIYRLFLGDGDFLLTTGNQLEARMNGTNEVRISDGSLIMQGRLAKIRATDGYDSLELDIGQVGYKRVDLVVAEYNQTVTSTEEEVGGEIVTVTDVTESVELKIIKGTPNANAYVEPEITTGNIDAGETHQMKLWAIRLDGINFDSLVDHRIILDTTPIQTALSVATQSVAQIEAQMSRLTDDVATFESNLNTSIYEYADELMQSVASGFEGSWRNSVDVSIPTDPIDVSITGYTYSQADIIEVYLNGLRLTDSEYSATGSGSTVSITLTATTFTGQLEVVVYRISESA